MSCSEVLVIALEAAFLMLPRSLLGSYGKPQDPVREELLSEVWYQPFQAKLWSRDRSACCSLCTVHFQSTRKHVNRALKKAGLDVSSSSNLVPTFHVIMANPSQKKSCP
ncbi:hypothetical protein Golax_023348 [Gossypium laxum]|uniref:Uncharacterized protein n=1 Tax=Gossypium laxum TaxID=34288 RepID=A0A7J9B4V4_9ROSI|nr:hypothetical protein [Gossypium laxum]